MYLKNLSSKKGLDVLGGLPPYPVFHRLFGASSSKDCAPVTLNASESDSDGGTKKKTRKYKRPRVNWEGVLSITKGADAKMDDDERKVQMAQGAQAFIEAGKIYKLPGKKSCAIDFGLWKLVKEWPAIGGASCGKPQNRTDSWPKT